MLLLLVALLAEVPVEVDPHSAFADRPWFGSLAADARDAHREAVERINAALGAKYEDHGGVRLRFLDLGEEGARSRPVGTRASASTQTEGGKECQRLEFYLEFVADRRVTVREEVLHEMVHAVMREQMGSDPYWGLPDWVREGLAVWVAGQADADARHAMSMQRDEDPLAFLRGLEPKDPAYSDYAQYGVAIERIARAKEGALPAFYDAVVRRRLPCGDAVREATGTEWEAFRAAALDDARRRFAPLAEGYAEFRAAHALFTAEGKAYDAERAFQALIEKYPEGVWAAPARYLMGRAQMMRGAKDCARQMFTLYLEADSGKTGYEGDALFHYGEIEFSDGAWRAAAGWYRRLILEQPYCVTHLPEAHARLVECLLKQDLQDDARKELATLQRLYPDHAATKRAEKAVGK